MRQYESAMRCSSFQPDNLLVTGWNTIKRRKALVSITEITFPVLFIGILSSGLITLFGHFQSLLKHFLQYIVIVDPDDWGSFCKDKNNLVWSGFLIFNHGDKLCGRGYDEFFLEFGIDFGELLCVLVSKYFNSVVEVVLKKLCFLEDLCGGTVTGSHLWFWIKKIN